VHLVFWRMNLLPSGCDPEATCTGTHNQLLAKSSANGVDWSLDEETAVTAGPGDWLPALVHDRAGDRLLVYFAAVARDAGGGVDLAQRQSRLYRVERTAGGWSQPVGLVGVNDAATHQSYPHVVQRGDGSFLMTWTRWDAAASADPVQVVAQPTSDTMVATSVDGLSWSTPRRMSDAAAGAVDVFPHLFAIDGGEAFTITFRTTARGVPTGSQVTIPVDGDYPADAVDRAEIAGYSARVVPTATPGVLWGAWVVGAEPTQKVQHRFLAAAPQARAIMRREGVEHVVVEPPSGAETARPGALPRPLHAAPGGLRVPRRARVHHRRGDPRRRRRLDGPDLPPDLGPR
jgi:hypothetical protein